MRDGEGSRRPPEGRPPEGPCRRHRPERSRPEARARLDAAWISAIVVSLLGLACGGAAATARPPWRPMVAPPVRSERRAAAAAFGRRGFAALRAEVPGQLLYGEEGLRALLIPSAAARMVARRPMLPGGWAGVSRSATRSTSHGSRAGRADRDGTSPSGGAGRSGPWRRAFYAGVCIQGARVEASGSPLGLREPTWVFERALIIGRRPDGRRIASWLEGAFAFSSRGFFALYLERVEAPRWEHSDLDLARCDLAVRSDRVRL